MQAMQTCCSRMLQVKPGRRMRVCLPSPLLRDKTTVSQVCLTCEAAFLALNEKETKRNKLICFLFPKDKNDSNVGGARTTRNPRDGEAANDSG